MNMNDIIVVSFSEKILQYTVEYTPSQCQHVFYHRKHYIISNEDYN